MKDSRTSSIVLHNGLIAVLALFWLIPIIWLVCTSFSAYSGMNTSTFFPKEWSIVNYQKLFHPDSVSQFPQWFLNTFIIACFTCVISTMFVLMVAYATSMMRFKIAGGMNPAGQVSISCFVLAKKKKSSSYETH